MSCARPKDPIAEAFERLCARDGARFLVLGPDRAATLAEVDGLARAAEARLDRALREAMQIGLEDRILAVIPWAHSYGLSSLVVPALAHGIQLVMPENGSPFGALASAARRRVTVFPTVPAWAAALLNLAEPPLPDTRAVVASRDSQVTAEAVITWCRARLSGYKVPRSVVLVSSIPRTPRGKTDRAALERLSVPAARPHG